MNRFLIVFIWWTVRGASFCFKLLVFHEKKVCIVYRSAEHESYSSARLFLAWEFAWRLNLKATRKAQLPEDAHGFNPILKAVFELENDVVEIMKLQSCQLNNNLNSQQIKSTLFARLWCGGEKFFLFNKKLKWNIFLCSLTVQLFFLSSVLLFIRGVSLTFYADSSANTYIVTS